MAQQQYGSTWNPMRRVDQQNPENWVENPVSPNGPIPVENSTFTNTNNPPSPWTGGVTGNGANPSTQTNTGYGGMARTASGSTITDFFRSRGLTDQNQLSRLQRDWTGWWNAWGRNDPEYFWRRIQNEDDLIGGPQNSPFAGSAGGGSLGVSATSPFTEQIRQLILHQIQNASQPVDGTDPVISSGVNAATLEGQRAAEQSRRVLAERLWAGGEGRIDQNAVNQGEQQTNERNATNVSNIRAQLTQQIYTQRRNELQQYLNMALQSGEAETARQIQMALAQLEAQIQREGLGVQLAGMSNSQNNNVVNTVV
jgi:hypothetical protein